MAEEDVFFSASLSQGETEDVRKGFASLSVSPNFPTPVQSLSSCSVHSGAEGATTSAAAGPSSSPYFSPRIQNLIERRGDLGSEVEFEIAASTPTWTETSAATSDIDDEKQRQADSLAFEKLKEDPVWKPFFGRESYELEIGGKIAEGGQAEIFEALGSNKREDARKFKGKTRLVVKVFKKGFPLEELQRQWPPGLAFAALPFRYFPRLSFDAPTPGARDSKHGLCWSLGAQLLPDGRFAFIFDRCWGDFRKIIDTRMLKSNGAPPFSLMETKTILRNIAQGMVMLHNCGLLHKDLKAANVLAVAEDGRLWVLCAAYIADFESSVGIVGTGFWRAPEEPQFDAGDIHATIRCV